MSGRPSIAGPTLYDERFEHDACGVGFVATTTGVPSHDIVAKAIESVINVTHRGAVDADAKSGDGAGIATALPAKLFLREVAKLGRSITDIRDLGVGMLFLPREGHPRIKAIIAEAVAREGLTLLGWREVPVNPAVLGEKAFRTRPDIQQVFIARPAGLSSRDFERRLFLARKAIERLAAEEGIDGFYVPSFSSRTVVYKGLFVAPQLAEFYRDLVDPDYESPLAIFHQRYSTNTFPNWFLAQPFRMLAHNGEINTLQGNQNWVRAREGALESPVWGERVRELCPIIQPGGSDSANLDNVLETLEQSGRSILHAMAMLVPEPWENMPNLKPEWRAFYEYHACLQEPWDGPAALAFTDGTIVGAVLDRNGLRPARYTVTDDGLVILGSEVGIVDLDPARVIEKGRLGPGQMIAVDVERKALLRNDDIKDLLASQQPYGEWVAKHLYRVDFDRAARASRNGRVPALSEPLTQLQAAFGYTAEEVRQIVLTMAEEAADPTWSMGDDTPIAVLSQKPRQLYNYFRQRFAQVTNPPIDPLREQIVMALNGYLGAKASFLTETPEHARLLYLETPVLLDAELDVLKELDAPAFRPAVIDILFPVGDGPDGLEAAIERLCQRAEAEVDNGASLLILSDRRISEECAPIPSLLAVGAVHHHLIRVGKRMRADIVVESGDCFEVHHVATLIGYGASAVNPYLALATARQVAIPRNATPEQAAEAADQAEQNFRHACEKALLKICSKMGISTVTSYRGGQIFEAIGLGQEVIDRCFTGTPSQIGGIGFREIAEDVLARHAEAFPTPPARLKDHGFIRYRREGEYHLFGQPVVRAMQRAANTSDYSFYEEFRRIAEDHPPVSPRDLLEIVSDRPPIPIEEVEPIEAITPRFISTAMSLGALSKEAHATLAIAMNRLGSRSNSGEGGEDEENYAPRPNGDIAHNKIKQVASGRFGVTIQYLAMSTELEIKMAQGSKPGEGGQLPGTKVSDFIARVRHAVPGIPLISPPPHHDIYSIEDLAQLIYDLKQANPEAKVGVKLVAETGVGTIAAGVAKAYADYILISGHSGGTGASPLSSIKNAGCPWELGLAETQQVLVLNDLRGRVSLRTDGALRTGRDVIIAALLGAEEFGFGTAALVAIGCDMARQCHLNTCPTGIATQREDLRAKFTGTPDQVVHYFRHLAQDVREWLAKLGYRSLDEIIGRVSLLRQRTEGLPARAAMLDLSRLLSDVDPSNERPRRRVLERNDRGDTPLDLQIVRDAAPAIERGEPVTLSYAVRNVHRALGTQLSYAVTRRWGKEGLPPGTIEVHFTGTAGQSFGAFCAPGVRLVLTGEANDYVGKGLSGGELIVKPPAEARYPWHENVIVGNTCLYGATSGRLFVAGRAGERFAVRNSGAEAVVEGVGDHGCEYMTSGLVVVLGRTGRNFGAGMSAGIAYVLDEFGDFEQRVNHELVELHEVTGRDAHRLREMVEAHLAATGSPRAAQLLADWSRWRPKFRKVMPKPLSAKLKAEMIEQGEVHESPAERVSGHHSATGARG
ncbi:MAG: glutamate synthase large subunit [Chloroflexota bacterium]|nr:glutamate synthase large subunit [Dehalococcoidia bacterium]MDW8254334.1 glutamate synthase large subunit [Chloroflexota bacterium]